MKLRTDFVTNSSSTSFVLVCKSELSFPAVCRLLGAPQEGPLSKVAMALYESLRDNAWTKERFAEWYYDAAETTEGWIAEVFDDKIAQKVSEAERAGQSVYMGRLSTDQTMIESFFCLDSMECESQDLYFSSLRSWF